MKKPKVIIQAFLQRVVNGSQPCGAVSLHLGNSKTEPLIKRLTPKAEVDLESLATEFLEVIEDDDGTYCLKAWHFDEETIAFTIPGEVSIPIQAKATDSTQQLLIDALKQSQSHNEVLMGYVANMVESSSRMSHRQADSAARVIGELGDTRLRMIQAEQEVLDRSHERLLESKKDERQAEFLSAAMKGFLALAPMFAGKLAGIMPMGADAVKASPQYQGMKALFEDIDESQWPAVHQWLKVAPLPPGQKAALEMAVESLITDMIETEKTDEKTTRGN